MWGKTFAGVVDAAERPPRRVRGEYGLLWELDPDAGVGRDEFGHELDLPPFPGVLGMPPPEPGVHSTTPPRIWGGNLHCKELVVGATLFLPIPVDGALFSAGDGHAQQGDGEISHTAIECPLERLELTLAVRDDWPLATPVARTPGAWLTLGLDEICTRLRRSRRRDARADGA